MTAARTRLDERERRILEALRTVKDNPFDYMLGEEGRKRAEALRRQLESRERPAEASARGYRVYTAPMEEAAVPPPTRTYAGAPPPPTGAAVPTERKPGVDWGEAAWRAAGLPGMAVRRAIPGLRRGYETFRMTPALMRGEIETVAEAARRRAAIPISPAYEKFGRAKGWKEAISALAEDPVGIMVEITGEAMGTFAPILPAAAGVGAAATLVTTPLGGLIAGGTTVGVGSGSIEYANKILECYADERVDITDAAELRKAFEDKERWRRIRNRALKKAVPIGVFDAVSVAIGGRLWGRAGRKIAGKLIAGTGEMGIQAALGGSGELVGQLVADGVVSAPDVLAEVIGEIGPGAFETTMAVRLRAEALQQGRPVSRARIREMVEQIKRDAKKQPPRAQRAERTGEMVRVEHGALSNVLQAGYGTPALERRLAELREEARWIGEPLPEPTPEGVEAPAPPEAGLPEGVARPEVMPGVAGAVEWADPETIGVHPGVQFKTVGIVDVEHAVSDLLKGVREYDVRQGGTISVWERTTGERYVAHGHHRLELAKRAERFVVHQPTEAGRLEPVEVPRRIPVEVLRESEGWTLPLIRGYCAIENIRDQAGTAIDATTAMKELGVTPDELVQRFGVSPRSPMYRHMRGLMRLGEETLDFVRRGDIPEPVGAAIGDTLTDPLLQAIAARSAQETDLGTYEQATLLAANVRAENVERKAAGEQMTLGDVLGAEEWVDTSGQQAQIQQRIIRDVQRRRAELLKPTDVELMEREFIDVEQRREMAGEVGETRGAVDAKLRAVFEYDQEVRNAIRAAASEIIAGRTTAARAAEEALPQAVEAARRPLPAIVRGREGLPGGALPPERPAVEEPPTERPPGVEEAEVEPWQMTREEFTAAAAEEMARTLERQGKHKTAARIRTPAVQQGELRRPDSAFRKRVDWHEFQVAEAVREGKPVPPEVLADYPSLAAKYAAPPEPSPAAREIERRARAKPAVAYEYHGRLRPWTGGEAKILTEKYGVKGVELIPQSELPAGVLQGVRTTSPIPQAVLEQWSLASVLQPAADIVAEGAEVFGMTREDFAARVRGAEPAYVQGIDRRLGEPEGRYRWSEEKRTALWKAIGVKPPPPPVEPTQPEPQPYYAAAGGPAGRPPTKGVPRPVVPPEEAKGRVEFPVEGGRGIGRIYAREVGPKLVTGGLKKWLGVFTSAIPPRGRVRVKTLEDLMTLAHETGHFVDWVIGQVKVERGSTFREELKAVAHKVRPFAEEFIHWVEGGKKRRRQTKLTAYRHKSPELFADYVSAYITEPDTVRSLAPKFTEWIEGEIAQNTDIGQAFDWVVGRMREFNEQFQPLKDYVESLRTIPELDTQIARWEAEGNLFQRLWRRNVGDRIWAGVEKLFKKFSATRPGRAVTEQRGLEDQIWSIIRTRRRLIDGQVLRLDQELIEPMRGMTPEDQEFIASALQRFEQLEPVDVKSEIAEKTRDELAVWGNEARKLGLLNDLTFWNNVGQYFPYFYTSKEFEQNTASFGRFNIKKFRTDMASFKHRLTHEEMGRRSLEKKYGTWPSSQKKIAQYTKEELIARGKQIREEMGLMKTAAYPVRERLRRMIQAVYTAKALNSIAEMPGVIGDRTMAGYVQMPEGQSLGNMSGQWVPERLAEELAGFPRFTNELTSAFDTATALWKMAKVPYDPAACTRNLVSNLNALWMGDIPVYDPRVTGRGLRSFARRDATYKLLRDHGLYRHTYSAQELQKLAQYVQEEPGTPIRAMLNWGLRGMDAPSRFYGAIEDACKTIAARYVLTKGATPEQAIQVADKWLFDYSTVSPLVGTLRKGPLPFVTWSAKMLPRLVETGIRKPEKYLTVYAGLAVAGAVARQQLGISREEEEAFKPEYAEAWWRPMIHLPWRDKNDELGWLDLTYYVPWGGWLETIDRSAGVPQPLQAGGPIVTLYNAYVQGFDPFVGEVARPYMTEAEKRAARLEYTRRGLLPSVIAGYGMERVWRAYKGQKDYYGRKPDVNEAWARGLTGLSIVRGGPETTGPAKFMRKEQKRRIEARRPVVQGLVEVRMQAELTNDPKDVEVAEEFMAALSTSDEARRRRVEAQVAERDVLRPLLKVAELYDKLSVDDQIAVDIRAEQILEVRLSERPAIERLSETMEEEYEEMLEDLRRE